MFVALHNMLLCGKYNDNIKAYLTMQRRNLNKHILQFVIMFIILIMSITSQICLKQVILLT